MRITNIKPGPIIKQLLNLVEDSWLENPELTKNNAEILVKGFYFDNFR